MIIAGSAADVRRRYYRRVRNAMLTALLAHALAFALAPPYTPRTREIRATPLRLVNAAGLLGVPHAARPPQTDAGPVPGAAENAAASRSVLAESRVVTEAAPGVAPPREGGATLGGDGGVQAGLGTPNAGSGLESDEAPVFYDFDTAPRAVRRVEPEYPLAARIEGAEGTVVVNANIDEQGRILRAWVAAKDAPDILVSAALDAAYQFAFLPGRQRGVPVKCTVAIPFRFSLNRIQ